MAYCKQCGAYIPDGQTGCLACGFDEAHKPAASSSASAAQEAPRPKTQEAPKPRIDSELLRRQMEEQRTRQREQSRIWAEQEATRRKAQQQEQQEEQSGVRFTGMDGGASDDDTRQHSDVDPSTSRFMSIVSYLSVLCFLPLFACKNDDYAMFHAKQGLRLFIFTAVGNVAGSFLGIGWLFTIAQIFFIIKGIGNAASGKKEPLPYIGSLFKF